MTLTAVSVSGHVDARDIAVLDRTSSPVDLDELRTLIEQCHHDSGVRVVVVSRGFIAGLLDNSQPSQEGSNR